MQGCWENDWRPCVAYIYKEEKEDELLLQAQTDGER